MSRRGRFFRSAILGIVAVAWLGSVLPAAQTRGAAARPAAAQTTQAAAPSSANGQAQPTEAQKEQRFDQAEISLWLRPLARVLHVSTDSLWAVVIWINFALLIYFLYYMLCRLQNWTLAGTMRGRRQTIQRRLAEADEARREAEERLRSIERRLEGLQAEIAQLREQATREAEAEYVRLNAESAAEAEKIARFAAQHIDAAAKAARQELRRFAGELAVTLAERELRRQMTADLDQRLIRLSLADMASDGRRAS